MRWFITKRHLVALIGVLVAILLLMAFTSCIPVTVRPQFDDKGLPVALPVTPVGSISPEGVMSPVYPVSAEAPKPPSDWWPMAQQVLLTLLGVAAGGGAALPLIGRAKTALRIACQLADAHARTAEDAAQRPPEEAAKALLDVERNKMIAAQQQMAAGVAALTQAVRGK